MRTLDGEDLISAKEVIDDVLNEWASAFEGTPEAQVEALHRLADMRDFIDSAQRFAPAIAELSKAVLNMPPNEWSGLCRKLLADMVTP